MRLELYLAESAATAWMSTTAAAPRLLRLKYCYFQILPLDVADLHVVVIHVPENIRSDSRADFLTNKRHLRPLHHCAVDSELSNSATHHRAATLTRKMVMTRSFTSMLQLLAGSRIAAR